MAVITHAAEDTRLKIIGTNTCLCNASSESWILYKVHRKLVSISGIVTFFQTFTVNGVPVVTANVICINGVIHLLSDPLLSPEPNYSSVIGLPQHVSIFTYCRSFTNHRNPDYIISDM